MSLPSRFVKMAGGGNDSLVFESDGRVLTDEDRRRLALVCRRGLSVGADGALFLSPDGPGRVRIDYFNSDGGAATFCANGTRCAARYAIRHGMAHGPSLEAHVLAPLITLIEGSSTDAGVVAEVRSQIEPGERVLVILDSAHSRDHVLAELEAYAPLVSVGSYVVAADGIMAAVARIPGGRPEWTQDNPMEAAREFAARNADFVLETPEPIFAEGAVVPEVTYWPSGYLRRLS